MALCTMCMHGIDVKKMWTCACGERHCPHMWACDKCRLHRLGQPAKRILEKPESIEGSWKFIRRLDGYLIFAGEILHNRKPGSEYAVSAGWVHVSDGKVLVNGESETLNLKPFPEDENNLQELICPKGVGT